MRIERADGSADALLLVEPAAGRREPPYGSGATSRSGRCLRPTRLREPLYLMPVAKTGAGRKGRALTDSHPLRCDDAALSFLLQVDGEPQGYPSFLWRDERAVGRMRLREGAISSGSCRLPYRECEG